VTGFSVLRANFP